KDRMKLARILQRSGGREVPHGGRVRRIPPLRAVRLRFCLPALLALSTSCLAAEPAPLIHAHAHNDYLHKRPLFEALERGFCSVEADIYLVDGKLLVAHERQMTRPERTLEALYLEPLRERVRKNGGRVYPHGPEFTLLIDLKT